MLNVLPDKITKTGDIALVNDNGEPFEDNDTVGAPDVPAKEITQ